MREIEQFNFLSSNKRSNINAVLWPADNETIGVVQISHGVAEHIKRYDHFARFLNTHGFAVAANDHIGHGESFENDEDYLYFDDDNGWFCVVEDMKKLHDIVSEKYAKVPYFIFGHSMGSFLTRSYLIIYNKSLSGAILSGTGYTPSLILSAGRAAASVSAAFKGKRTRSTLLDKLAFGGYNKAFAPNRTKSDWLTRDNTEVDKYISDPKCGGIPTTGLFMQMFRGIAYNQKPSNLLLMDKNLPVLFISGDADPVGGFGEGVKNSYKTFVKAGMKDVSFKLYHNARHELLNETNKYEAYSYISDWLLSKINSKNE